MFDFSFQTTVSMIFYICIFYYVFHLLTYLFICLFIFIVLICFDKETIFVTFLNSTCSSFCNTLKGVFHSSITPFNVITYPSTSGKRVIHTSRSSSRVRAIYKWYIKAFSYRWYIKVENGT